MRLFALVLFQTSDAEMIGKFRSAELSRFFPLAHFAPPLSLARSDRCVKHSDDDDETDDEWNSWSAKARKPKGGTAVRGVEQENSGGESESESKVETAVCRSTLAHGFRTSREESPDVIPPEGWGNTNNTER